MSPRGRQGTQKAKREENVITVIKRDQKLKVASSYILFTPTEGLELVNTLLVQSHFIFFSNLERLNRSESQKLSILFIYFQSPI